MPRTTRPMPADSMRPLLDLVLERVPGPEIDAEAPLQMLVTTLDWSEYVGRIAVGRIQSGRDHAAAQQVALMQAGDNVMPAKVIALHVFDKLGRTEVEEADGRRHRGRGRPGASRNRRHDQRRRQSAGPCRASKSTSRRWK